MASDSVAEPLSAWAPKAPGPLKTPWRPLSVQTVYSVSGGYLGAKKTCALSSKTLDVQRTVDGSDITVAATFIRINKNDDWMLKAVGGPKAQKGFLKRTTLIERMRSKLVDRGLCDTSVADERVDDDGDDPMGQLDCPVERPASRPKRTRYARKRVKNQEVTITMPMYASCAYPDNKETKDVTVMADGTNQLWVLKEDLPWLVLLEELPGGLSWRTVLAVVVLDSNTSCLLVLEESLVFFLLPCLSRMDVPHLLHRIVLCRLITCRPCWQARLEKLIPVKVGGHILEVV